MINVTLNRTFGMGGYRYDLYYEGIYRCNCVLTEINDTKALIMLLKLLPEVSDLDLKRLQYNMKKKKIEGDFEDAR